MKKVDSWGFSYTPFYSALKRFVKVSAVILVSGWISYINENPSLVFIAPVLLAVDKFLQEKGLY